MNVTPLTSLAARAEAGSAPDPLLQFDVTAALGWTHAGTVEGWTLPDGRRVPVTPDWLGSLDAVAALIAERLPGIGGNGWGVSLDPADGFTGYVTRNNVREGHWLIEVYGKSPARCLLSAFLKALAAQQQDRPTEGE